MRAGNPTRIPAFWSLALLVAVSIGVLVAAGPARAATFTVNSTGDAGDTSPDGVCDSNFTVTVTCTLREAIQEANASTTADDAIGFAIPTSACGATTGVCTIFPASGLPAVTDRLTIDGYSQPGADENTGTGNTINAELKIELSGRNAGAFAQGVFLSGPGAAGSRVRGLVVNRFAASGVFSSADAVVVEGNFIGTDASGFLDRGNGTDGVRVTSSGSLVGGTSAASRNVISGNGGNGVSVLGPESTNNVVQGNHIGTNADATGDLGNARSGVRVEGPGVLVGGSSAGGAGNVIGGNDRHGVEIDNIFAEGAEVKGNLIGVNGNDFSSIGNAQSGVRVGSTPRVEIGGAAGGEGNTISDNGQHGVEIVGTSSTFGKVLGNRIGTNPEGTFGFGNAVSGVRVASASNTTVGGTTGGARNLISGNGGDGVALGPLATENRVEGNRIGTDATGTSAIANAQGVNITGGSGNRVGGPAVGAGNLISGNTGRGVLIAGDATETVVQSNFIGTDVFGGADLGNGDDGVEVFEGSNNVVGGTLSRTGNIISGNQTNGVEINLDATDTRVQGNLIGTGQNGRADIGNGEVGVLVRGPGNLVGGTVGLARNVVSGNAGVGVTMLGAGGNTVQGNLIGTQVDGVTPLPNFHGVFVSDASDNTIGGTVAAAANTVSGNANHGVMVLGDGARRNSILRNSIFDNGRLGIELNNDGVTPNDGRDPDVGPNGLQNFPVITSAGTTRIEGRLNSRPERPFTVQFFSNPQPNFPTGFGEGKTFLGEKTVRTNRRGKVSFSFTTTVPAGEVVTATATDRAGNTSELSAARAVTAP